MTAFPAPGYMPSELISSGSAAWSVSFNPNVLQVADESKVQVIIRDLDNGEIWTRSAAEDTLQSWSDGMVFAQPKISDGRYKDSYSVEITGLTDVATKHLYYLQIARRQRKSEENSIYSAAGNCCYK